MNEPEYTHELAIKIRFLAPEDDTAFEMIQTLVQDALHDVAAIERPSDDAVITAPIVAGWDMDGSKFKMIFRRVYPHNYNSLIAHMYEANKAPATDKPKLFIAGLMERPNNMKISVELESIMRMEGAESITEGITKGQASFIIECLQGRKFPDDWDK